MASMTLMTFQLIFMEYLILALLKIYDIAHLKTSANDN